MDYSPESVYKLWLATVARCRQGQREMTSFENDSIVGKIEVKFYGYLLVALRTMTQSCNQHMFYLTHVAKYHGMSRLGVGIQAALGWALPLSTYDDRLKSFRSRKQQERKYITLTFQHLSP